MAGLLDFLGLGRGGMDENGVFHLQDPAMLGLLGQQAGQTLKMPMGLLSGNPMTPAPMEPQSFSLNGPMQPSTQGWSGGVMPGDIPAPGASAAGPAMSPPPPMPPQRPQGLGIASPTPAQGLVPIPPERPAGLGVQPAAPAGLATQPQAPQGESTLAKLGKLAGSIYGQGGPGDNLIALGAGLMSGPNAGAGLMKGMSLVAANALTAKKKEDEQKKAAGQMLLAQHLAKQSGGKITPEAALGIIQSGNAGQFLTDQFRSPTSEQEYKIYQTTETQAGRQPMTFDQWYTRNKQIESGVGETAFEQSAGKAQVDRLGKIVEGGSQARQSIMDIGKLREISSRFGSQGSLANTKLALGPYAEALGIKIDGLDDIQTFNAIVQRVAPTLREPGSGSTSDIEFKGMLSSLPQLSQNPQARGAVLDMMEAMARDKAARADIAGKILNREIDRREGEKMLRELPDPMTGFKAFKEQNPGLFATQAQTPLSGQNEQPPLAGARKAADGEWYVQQDGKWFKVQR